MTRQPRQSPTDSAGGPGTPDQWVLSVGTSAAAASHVPVELLGEYLPMLADAAVQGRRPQAWELDAVRLLGRRAAEQGVGPSQAVDLYLSAAWRLWQELPMVVRSRDRDKVRAAAGAVLRVLADAVSALVDGYTSERREMIRHEEALRREFIDDLLRGDADVSRMVERAEPFGLDLTKAHHVVIAAPMDGSGVIDRAAILLERLVVDRFGDRDVLVYTKDGRLVVLIPTTSSPASSERTLDVGLVIHRKLERLETGYHWRVAAGRAFPGAYGVARSYEEAREALDLADRLNPDAEVVDARELLVYRMLGRDRAALVDLVRDVLGPLEHIRGGPDVLVETLYEYFNAGDVATEAAQRLNVSVRTVTYRLARITELTGYRHSRPDQRFALHAAVLGARLLDWPRTPLPTP
jgi:sugar diacid utilization regulator